MDSMTLREICERTKVTRRALQGYEKALLVKPSGRNKYGHLLYDSLAEERIKEIYFYQQIGFPVKEIAKIIDAENSVKREAIKMKLFLLREKSQSLAELIVKTEKRLESLKNEK